MGRKTTNKFNFTKKFLLEVEPPKTKSETLYHDKAVQGLVLRVRKSGTKMFYVYVNKPGSGRPIWVKLGKFPDMPIEKARKHAHDKLSDIASGIDPNAAKKDATLKDGTSLQTAFDNYHRIRGVKSVKNPNGLKTSTLEGYQIILDRYFGDWKDRTLLSFTDKEISDRHYQLTKRGERTADKALAVLRLIFNHAIAFYRDSENKPIYTTNPCDILTNVKQWNQPRGKRTGRVIKPEQLKTWWNAVMGLKEHVPERRNKNAPQARVAHYYFQTLLMTGLRPTECASIQWSQVNIERKFVTFEDENALQVIKNAKNFELPLSNYVANLLEEMYEQRLSDYVFPNNFCEGPFHESSARDWLLFIEKKTGVKITRKDCRATFITIANLLGISEITIKRLVNHTHAGSQDVTHGYVVSQENSLRDASNLISEFILDNI